MKHFKVPDNYFDNFADNIDAKIKELSETQNTPEIKQKNKNTFNLKTVLSAAAAAITILLASVVFFQSSQQEEINIKTETLALSNDEYIELMLEQLDTDVVEDLIDEADYNY